MNLQALLVSSDNSAADVLGRVLAGFGIALDRSSDPETTIARIQQQRFDALLVDFDDAKTATQVVELAHQLGWGNDLLTVALVADRASVRSVLSSGAHFVLYKPVSERAAQAALRPAAALLNRERRCAVRVPVQAAVEVTLPDKRKLEGILLDLSETGMEVLTAEPQSPQALLSFRFQIDGIASEIEGHGQVAWANPNGQAGVHFVGIPPAITEELKMWLRSAAMSLGDAPDEIVPHCKLTDLSLGGCYVETDAPFPERALIDLGLKTGEMEVHIEGMVRVAHPGRGMGVEFPSRTSEQRAQVGRLIDFLRSCPDRTPELNISPRALVADLTQFQPQRTSGEVGDELEDPLLELLQRGATLQEADFLGELQRQRTPEDLASV